MKQTAWLLGAALIIGASTTANAETLTNAEIRSVFVGNTVEATDGAVLRFNANGTYQKLHKPNLEPLRYSITNNQLCLTHENRRQRCDDIIKRGNRYYAVSSRSGREYLLTVRK